MYSEKDGGIHVTPVKPAMVCPENSHKVRHIFVHREMEIISRGPTFEDFVTIRTEWSMQDVTFARLKSTRLQTPLAPLL